jgi:GTP-binding protein
MRLPHVAIVGRPNVGKSSLLNCFAEERVSIVEETPGVTRDRVSTIIFHRDVSMEVVDTGGIGIIDCADLGADIDRQIELALASADLILFVVDAQEGVCSLDREVAARLRENPHLQDRPVLLVANKVDSLHYEDGALDFFGLGLGDPYITSALHGFGRSDLLDRVVEKLAPTGPVETKPVMRLAVVGRQNVGKSTYVNSMAREDRCIVSEIPGTTRDAVDVRFEKDKRQFVIIDTAGMKRRSRLNDSIEFYSQARTESAIRRSDVVLFMLDASSEISRVDKKICESIVRLGKACVLVVNKWDLTMGAVNTESFADYTTDRLPGLTFAPMVFTTSRDGRNIQSPVDVAQHLFKSSRTRVGTGELNRAMERIKTEHRPPRVKGHEPKIFFATQVGLAPPTFVIFVNNPKSISKTYRRYIENKLRDEFSFKEIPLRVFYRQRQSIYSNK